MMDHFGEPPSIPQAPVDMGAPDENINNQEEQDEWYHQNHAGYGAAQAVGGQESGEFNRRPSTVKLLLKNSVVHFEEETDGAPPTLQEMCRQRSQSDMTANKTDASVLIGEYDPTTQELQYVNPYRMEDSFTSDGGLNLGAFPSYIPSSVIRKQQHQPGLEGIEEGNDDEEGLLGSCPSPDPASASVLAHLDGLLATPPMEAAQDIAGLPAPVVNAPPASAFPLYTQEGGGEVGEQEEQGFEENNQQYKSPQKYQSGGGSRYATGSNNNMNNNSSGSARYGQQQQQQPIRKGGGPIRNSRETLPHDGPNTTVMFRNIPNRFSPEALREVIRDKGFAMSMDFFYMPMDFQNQCNLGYAFINFVNVDELERFTEEFNGQKLPMYKSHKVCEVCPARVQGLKANVDHFRKSAARGTIPDEYKPVCFRNGVMIPFPPPERAFNRMSSGGGGDGGGDHHRRSSKSSTHSGTSSRGMDANRTSLRAES